MYEKAPKEMKTTNSLYKVNKWQKKVKSPFLFQADALKLITSHVNPMQCL